MKGLFYSTLIAMMILIFGSTLVFATAYTFTGDVYCKEGSPIEGAVAHILYFYTFEGGPTMSGSAYVTTDASGIFTLQTDISGSSPVEYVEAWAWVGGKEKYLSDCQPIPDNYFGYWKFTCSGPEIWFDYHQSP